jgi:hypothetical protein
MLFLVTKELYILKSNSTQILKVQWRPGTVWFTPVILTTWEAEIGKMEFTQGVKFERPHLNQ